MAAWAPAGGPELWSCGAVVLQDQLVLSLDADVDLDVDVDVDLEMCSCGEL